jgi:hypothetical protein
MFRKPTTRDMLSRKGTGGTSSRDLDAFEVVDLKRWCMNTGAALGNSGGSFKTGRVRGWDVLELGEKRGV